VILQYWKSVFLACAVSLLLVGCSTTNSVPVAVQQSPAGRKLAIVSAIGTEMHVKRLGTTVFGNKEKVVDVGAWELDLLITERVAAHAKERGFDVVVLNDASVHAMFRKIDSEDSVKMWRIGEQRKKIAEFAKANGVDMVLAITAPDYTDVIFGSNQTIRSFGIYELSSLFATQGVEYALAQTVIFNGADGKQMAYQTDYARHDRPKDETLPDDLTVDPRELEEARAIITQLYERLIADELNKLKL